MNYQLRPAVSSSAKLLIGFYSESGGGKTLSALLLARGFVGPDAVIAMIETESGRGEVYSRVVPGGYLVRPIAGDFNPKAYGEAIADCEKAGAKALIIDSASHEWEGAGGVLSLAADNQAAGKKGPLVWQQPKMSHQRDFVLKLMATPIDIVIVCMRAKYPMEEVAKPGGGKDWARSKNLDPKQSEDILFEMFIHGWFDKENHHFHPTKYPKAITGIENTIRADEIVTIETGKRLAQWASGAPKEFAPPASVPPRPDSLSPVLLDTKQAGADPSTTAPGALPSVAPSAHDRPPNAVAQYITTDQATDLLDRLREAGIDPGRLLKVSKVDAIGKLPADGYQRACDWITKASETRP